MNARINQKAKSLERILEAAARRLREEGLDGAAIAPIMKDAGLTHGAFYAHFDNKESLSTAALEYALGANRKIWIGTPEKEKWRDRLARLARGYLNKKHRDNPAAGCALSAVASEAGRSSPAFKASYEAELKKSLAAISLNAPTRSDSDDIADEAIAFMALCVGGITLARAVENPDFSNRIIKTCRKMAERLAADK